MNQSKALLMTRYLFIRKVLKGFSWKQYLLDALISIVVVVAVTFVILFFQFTFYEASLWYLFAMLCVVYKRGFRCAIFTASAACASFDFFLIRPLFSFNIDHFQDALDLFLFLLVCIAISYLISRLRQQAKLVKRQEESKLHVQIEEINRRDYEVGVFYNVVQATRDVKDLKYQLGLIAQALKDVFSSYGVRSCFILLPDLEGKPAIQIVPELMVIVPPLTSDEEGSFLWVMKHGEAVVLPDAPLISHPKGPYLRRVIGASTSCDGMINGYSFLVPLWSRRKVVGVLRLLLAPDMNPRLFALINSIHMKAGVVDPQSELFKKLLDCAVSLIEQSLIEQALVQQENLRNEFWLRKEEMQAEIISLISHDLRAPLALIIDAASSLLDQALVLDDEVEHRHTLEAIIDEASWLERVVSKLLSLSHIEQGVLKPEKELYPIDEILLNTLELGHIQSLLQHRFIEKRLPDDLPPVEVDPILIRQVLSNLIENAAHHTPSESPIEISARVNGKQMVVSVADHGPGIPPADKKSIFEKFYQVKKKTEKSLDSTSSKPSQVFHHEGLGLGLAVCSGIVNAHGGYIWVENRDGGGANFQFTLPLN